MRALAAQILEAGRNPFGTDPRQDADLPENPTQLPRSGCVQQRAILFSN